MKASVEQRLRPVAERNNGVIPVWEAKTVGVSPGTLRKWASQRDDVDHACRGGYVWWLDDLDIDFDALPFSETAASVGSDAVLTGPSVLELLGLGTADGGRFMFETPRRRRRRPDVRWFTVKIMDPADFQYRGVRCRNVRDALRTSRTLMDSDKFAEAVNTAFDNGFIGQWERDELLRR